jgi:excinuclease ABC subunit C
MEESSCSALKSLDALELRGKIAIIGIAKDWRNFYPGDSVPLYLDKIRNLVIQQLRNEAHRFGITHHRDKRSKAAFKFINRIHPGIVKKQC